MLGQIKLKKEIATRLRLARTNAGYASAEDFCEKNQLPLDDYPRHEAGTLAIRASHALRYCKLLEVSLYWLMTGEFEIK